MLNHDALLITKQSERVVVEDFLGAGGQGEVYRVSTPRGPMALKWYFPSSATRAQREIIERLVTISVDPKRFLWPQALVTEVDGPNFGYTMPLRPPEYHSLPELFRRRVPGITLRALLIANLSIVEAYRTLHSQGIAYRDISWGNVFFNPITGDALICDNDNAIFEGQQTGVDGTMVFMAPELVRGEARPSTQTDLHSLAVLLFMMLMNEHPLHGARELQIHCMDAQAQKRLYGEAPVFMFDAIDRSNAAVTGEHDNARIMWTLIPQRLKALFDIAFTEGLHNPDARIREGQWVDAFTEVLDSIVYCSSCGRQNFHDADAYQRTRTSGTCWRCRKGLILPPNIRIEGRVVMLNRDARIYSHHLDRTAARDFQSIVAEVTEHPTKVGTFGLTNRSQDSWIMRAADNSETKVGPGKTVPFKNGLTLLMSDTLAEIQGSMA